MKNLGSLLFLLLSSGQCYVHLSARKHRATSTTCLTTSQQLGEVDADSECNLKCSLSCDMIVQTDVRQDKEAKRFLFLISEVEADCPGLQVSQLHLPVAVAVEGPAVRRGVGDGGLSRGLGAGLRGGEGGGRRCAARGVLYRRARL